MACSTTFLIPALALLTIPSTVSTSFAGELDSLDVNAIIRKVDELYRSKSSYAELEMEIVTPHWQRTLSMNAWSEGMDKTFIRITSPKKEDGMATLRIENEMWNYLPKTNKVMKIPPSMMMSSWMGSDFTNDDLVKEFSLFEDYTYELIEVEGGREDLYYIKSVPREGLPVVWSHIVIAVRKGDYLPEWQKFYDEKENLMRIWTYSDIRTFGGRTLPATMEMLPQNKEGHKTVIRYLKAEFDIEFDRDIFSLRNLRSRQ
jgi:outer membrane lipoprotein-sorting protein